MMGLFSRGSSAATARLSSKKHKRPTPQAAQVSMSMLKARCEALRPGYQVPALEGRPLPGVRPANHESGLSDSVGPAAAATEAT